MDLSDYKKYIKSCGWKKLRKECLIRDKYICRYCNDKATEVHHILYPNDFKKDCLSNVVSCCKKCHEEKHNIVGYDKLGTIKRKELYHVCNVCLRSHNEFYLDMENGNWICNLCEELKGDNDGE